MTLTGKLDTSTFISSGRVERPAEKPGTLVLNLRISSRSPTSASGPALRPPADGDLGPGRHLRGRNASVRETLRADPEDINVVMLAVQGLR
jgi:hypothetical protein